MKLLRLIPALAVLVLLLAPGARADQVVVHLKSGSKLMASAALHRNGYWEVTLLSGGILQLRDEIVQRVDSASPLAFGQEPGNRITAEPIYRPAEPESPRNWTPDPMQQAVTDEEKVEASKQARLPAGRSATALADVEVPTPPSLLSTPDGRVSMEPRRLPPPEERPLTRTLEGPQRKEQMKGGFWHMKKKSGGPPSVREEKK